MACSASEPSAENGNSGGSGGSVSGPTGQTASGNDDVGAGDDTPGGTSAIGGATTNDDASGGTSLASGGDGSGAVSEVTETEACVRYVEAWCELKVRCGVYSDFPFCMLTVGQVCPDLSFAERSARSIEGTLACAEILRTWHCNDTIEPDCVIPGTAPLGDPCINASQCESGSCSGSAAQMICGTCLPIKAVGEVCDYVDRCESGARCDDATGVCTVADVPEEDPGVIERPRRATCELTSVCEAGYYCALAPGASDLACVPIPDERVPAGEACTESSPPCEDGTHCYCAGDDCTERACFAPRKVGESCDDGAARCHAGATCNSGVCVASGQTGVFEAACGE